MITVGMADDHKLVRQSIAEMITSFGNYEVLWQADNGMDAIKYIQSQEPHILLLDIRMPEMDGFETAAYVMKNYPDVRMLALSMMDDDFAIVKMLQAGVKGYISKDAEPAELRQALQHLATQGYYFNDMVTGKLVHQASQQAGGQTMVSLTAKEEEFLKLASTELTYKEIAERMHVSPRTVDGYRDLLFDKLGVKSRVGLVLFSLKRGIASL
mgnify:CR=1 FL=1